MNRTLTEPNRVADLLGLVQAGITGTGCSMNPNDPILAQTWPFLILIAMLMIMTPALGGGLAKLSPYPLLRLHSA